MGYKLLVIDDEKLIREGLPSYIDWASLGIEIVGTAGDGETAVKIIEEKFPDLILSDIRMPNMDGIELIAYLREKKISCEVIFISAYSEFQYAQCALRYGAFDYLLKPISEQALISCILKCLEKLKLSRQTTPETYTIQNLQDMLEHFYLKDLGFTERFLSIFHTVTGKDFASLPKTLLVISSFSSPNISETLENLGAEIILCNTISSDLTAFLICGQKFESESLLSALKRMQSQYSFFYDFQAIRDQHLFWYLSTALYHILLKKCPQGIEIRRISEQEYASYVYASLADYMESGNVQLIEAFLYSFLSYHYKNGTIYQFGQFLHHCISVIYITYDVLREKYGSLPENFPQPYEYVKKISDCSNLCEVFEILEGSLQGIVEKLQLYMGKNKISLQAVEYIHSHYTTEISLGQLAKIICVSPSYLSKIFKEDFGVSFTDYLLRYRMNAAKKMLHQGNRKIYEVAASVGYQDVTQFTKMFKKEFGISPKQWIKSGKI